jgi:hypothetical protein
MVWYINTDISVSELSVLIYQTIRVTFTFLEHSLHSYRLQNLVSYIAHCDVSDTKMVLLTTQIINFS